ncbi:MAG TPA: peptidase T [Candidatus Scatomorpha pullistercoris]|uniref:Peptidase T n=1 Tax=Candidatus Scatomorpha pullistercoris TaxID=2840929 RepID=A0A9D1G2J8_9FIRM|nr:peptidase T [Candidatus Scatomorpha pullistercoris]
MRAYERLLGYVKVNTASSESGAGTSPSTQRQFDLARLLADELRALGVADAELTGSCYVYGHLEATPGCEGAPGLGLIAHMDTAPDFSGENVRPRVIENYDGGEVELGAGRTLSAKDFPHLPSLKGRTLITTSGDTLLGADDKAGIAEIITLIEQLQTERLPHGRIAVCFTPDEEIGYGTAELDLDRLGADYAYTIDGGPEGEIVYENFNAVAATVQITGVNVHPGSAKNIMVNAAQVATEFNACLPCCETPRYTEGYEGFYHLTSIEGTVERAELRYILRDHDAKKLEQRRETMQHVGKILNERYGAGTVSVSFREQYRNMVEKIVPEHMHLVDSAIRAIEDSGLEPLRQPIRGGTDGALLSWEGLPCPNLGTGGYAYHGPYEHITAEGMDKCVEIMRRIVETFSERRR